MKVEWKSCFRIGVTIFLLHLCIVYWSRFSELMVSLLGAALPLLLGCILAYIINILMSFYEKHYFVKTKNAGLNKSRRPVCMIAAFITLFIILALLGKMVLPELIACVELLLAKIPDAIESVVDWLREMELLSTEKTASLQNVDWKSRIQEIISILLNGVGNAMGTAVNLVSTVFSGVVTALFTFIFSIYILSGKEKLGAQFDKLMNRYMKKKIYERIKYILAIINDCFHKYIVGQCTEAVILGTLCAVGMIILRFPYATMTGAVMAFTALIPVAGGYIGAAIGAFMIMTVSPIKAILFLIYIVVLQQLENNLIYPKVVGSSMGLPAIWVLAAVTIGGGIMGIVGMLIGVPLAAAAYRLLREDVNRLPKEKQNDR